MKLCPACEEDRAQERADIQGTARPLASSEHTCAGPTLIGTWWRSVHAPADGLAVSWSDQELSHWLAHPPAHAGEKGDLPAWSPATFTDGYRKKANVTSVSALVFDVDEPEAEPAEFFARVGAALDPFAWWAHSSPSSKVGAFKFRVIVPTDAALSPADHGPAWARVARMLAMTGVAVDRACKDESRLFFVPAVLPGGAYAWHEGNGVALSGVDAAERERAEIARRAEQEARLAASQRTAHRTPGPRRSTMDVVERARRYVDRVDPAIAGSHGHDQTFIVALKLHGFGLDESDAWSLLAEYNQRCLPPWSERELRRKLREAFERARAPRGFMLDGGR